MIEASKEQLGQAAFELYLWRTTDGTNFTCQLFDLFAKADTTNQLRLAKGFPAEAEIYTQWRRAKSEDDFYRRWRLGKYRFSVIDTNNQNVGGN